MVPPASITSSKVTHTFPPPEQAAYSVVPINILLVLLHELVVEPIAPVVLPMSVVFSISIAVFGAKTKDTLLAVHNICPPSSITTLLIAFGIVVSAYNKICVPLGMVKVPEHPVLLIQVTNSAPDMVPLLSRSVADVTVQSALALESPMNKKTISNRYSFLGELTFIRRLRVIFFIIQIDYS